MADEVKVDVCTLCGHERWLSENLGQPLGELRRCQVRMSTLNGESTYNCWCKCIFPEPSEQEDSGNVDLESAVLSLPRWSLFTDGMREVKGGPYCKVKDVLQATRRAVDLLVRATSMFENDAPDENWFKEYFLLIGEHAVLTDEGWQMGREGLDPGSILDEVNTPDSTLQPTACATPSLGNACELFDARGFHDWRWLGWPLSNPACTERWCVVCRLRQVPCGGEWVDANPRLERGAESDKPGEFMRELKRVHRVDCEAYCRGEASCDCGAINQPHTLKAPLDDVTTAGDAAQNHLANDHGGGLPAGNEEAWPMVDVLRKLAFAAEHLGIWHDCDHHGYEEILAAKDAAYRYLALASKPDTESALRGDTRERGQDGPDK